jgi:hypothetical protein
MVVLGRERPVLEPNDGRKSQWRCLCSITAPVFVSSNVFHFHCSNESCAQTSKWVFSLYMLFHLTEIRNSTKIQTSNVYISCRVLG